MKKLTSLCLAALLLFALAAQVSADVIWEPLGGFFEAHREDCEYVEYIYEAQKDTRAFLSPEDAPAEQPLIPAGTTLFVNYLWQEGRWGATYVWDLAGVPNGDYWVQLADFRRCYWKSDFANEHKAEFKTKNGSVPVTGTAYLWAFPGSDESYEITYEDSEIAYDAVYTDEEGREWGRVGYYFGHKNEWVCISEPGNKALPKTAPKYADADAPAGASQPTLGLSAARDPSSDAVASADTPALAYYTRTSSTELPPAGPAGQAGGKLLLPVLGLVVLVVAGTAVLLILLRRRAKREKE